MEKTLEKHTIMKLDLHEIEYSYLNLHDCIMISCDTT